MTPKARNQVANVVSVILLGLIVCAMLSLAVFLFLSPTLR